MNKQPWLKTAKASYAFLGVLFGFCFPIFGSGIELTLHNMSFSLENLIQIQKMNAPLLYIIDMAPFLFGLFAYFAGVGEDSVTKENFERRRAEKELEKYRDHLEELVELRTSELQAVQKQLLETAHQTGMAEIATNVLHNVGNVLNSAITSTTVISETINNSKLKTFDKLVSLIQKNQINFQDFVTNDPKGKKMPTFLSQLNQALLFEKEKNLNKLKNIANSHEHIREIIALQQSYTGVSKLKENVDLPALVKDAANLFGASFQRHDIDFSFQINEELPQITLEKNKAIQIIINLLKNARDAVKDGRREVRRITVKFSLEGDYVKMEFEDNGIGIVPENLNKIFNYGFSTKSKGHGFGLHSSANLAVELGGKLSSYSEGPGKGANFTLVLPINLT